MLSSFGNAAMEYEGQINTSLQTQPISFWLINIPETTSEYLGRVPGLTDPRWKW
jgi:hypothetical protein